MTKPISFLLATGFAGFGVYAAVTAISARFEPKAKAIEPPILQRIQALGDLHAVKFNYQDVHQFETSMDPSPVVSVIPGGSDLVHLVTRNSALMSFDGSVEAGVDLTQAKISRTQTQIRIELPKPKLFEPQVTAHVQDANKGLMWRDVSLTTSAIADARDRFRASSLKQGIMDQAKKNAANRVLTLAHSLTNQPVEVVFRA